AAKAAGALQEALQLLERSRDVRDLLVKTPADATGNIPERARQADAARRDETVRRREKALLETFFEVARRLVEERDPDRVVAAVLDHAIEATGAERGFVLLSPEQTDLEPGSKEEEDERKRDLPGGLKVAAARNFDRA